MTGSHHPAPAGAVKVPGVAMVFEGAEYIVPPLNAAAVKQYRDQVASLMIGSVPDIEVIVRLLHAALARNYPGILLEQVEQWVDFANMLAIMDAVMHVSGLAEKMGELGRRMQAASNPPAQMTSTT